MALLSHAVRFLSGPDSQHNKFSANNKSLPARRFGLGGVGAQLVRTQTINLKKLLLLIQSPLRNNSQVSLTLHGEGLSRHRDVALAFCGEAVVQQVVFLRDLHQRVVCGGGQRSRIRANYQMHKQETCVD